MAASCRLMQQFVGGRALNAGHSAARGQVHWRALARALLRPTEAPAARRRPAAGHLRPLHWAAMRPLHRFVPATHLPGTRAKYARLAGKIAVSAHSAAIPPETTFDSRVNLGCP
jgi:hypothetical protein